jgi:hypothetical protein
MWLLSEKGVGMNDYFSGDGGNDASCSRLRFSFFLMGNLLTPIILPAEAGRSSSTERFLVKFATPPIPREITSQTTNFR